MKKIILLLCGLFFFTGCYDYTELNDTAIISGAAVAYKDKNYEVTFEIIVTKKSDTGEQEQTKTMLVTGKGSNPAKAFNNTMGKVDKKTILNHLQVVILDESLAKKEGIKHLSNYLFRDIHISNNFYYILAKNVEAKKILNTKVKNEPIVSTAIINLFNNENDVEILDLKSEFDYLYADMKAQKKDIVIPSITLNNKNISLGTLGIFKKDKLKDYLNKTESQTYYLLKSKTDDALYSKENIAISIYKNKPKIKIKNNTVNISLKAEGLIRCLNEDYVLRTSKANKKLSKEFSTMVKKDIKKLLEKSIESNSDFLGIDEIFYQTYPKSYQKNIWKSLNYKVNVDLIINRNGQTFEVIN